MLKYPVNREFVKTIRHNKHNYTLRSIFDKSSFGFDSAIARFNINTGTYSFDNAITDKLYNLLKLSEYTDSFENVIED